MVIPVGERLRLPERHSLRQEGALRPHPGLGDVQEVVVLGEGFP